MLCGLMQSRFPVDECLVIIPVLNWYWDLPLILLVCWVVLYQLVCPNSLYQHLHYPLLCDIWPLLDSPVIMNIAWFIMSKYYITIKRVFTVNYLIKKNHLYVFSSRSTIYHHNILSCCVFLNIQAWKEIRFTIIKILLFFQKPIARKVLYFQSNKIKPLSPQKWY